MAQDHLSNDEFFTQLASVLQKTQKKGHGSVFLAQKRLTYQADSAPGQTAENKTWPLLVRATDGKSQSKDRVKNKDKIKLSTVVQPQDIAAFYTRYADVCKAGMQSLKKRDRNKKKKKDKKKKKAGEGEGGSKATQ
ncbi:signal recognition particle, SRP9/SRP14 subunit [Piedraia hortae CBS 480.64]|uniref:Signal recognition particle subunit SRP14 n=1 Tax=Piedraia hortae CBS 480.64 TaxID=1314780 RepID=A0A6A7BUX8_9PEZI|nr:signal recognition particle, SRP9/SRP14 subunit [Piedraia hortae CBS 480.64]